MEGLPGRRSTTAGLRLRSTICRSIPPAFFSTRLRISDFIVTRSISHGGGWSFQNLRLVALLSKPLLAIRGAALGQEHVDGGVRAVIRVENELHQAPRVAVHRRLAELHRVHLAEAFEALDVDLRLDPLRLQALQDTVALVVVERVVDVPADVDAVERRHGHVHAPLLHELTKMPYE